MSPSIFKRVVLVLVTAGSLGFSAAAKAQGLSFASEEKLRGIPLASTPFAGAELPGHVDMSNMMPPVGNQGQQSSCVAWTIAYALKSYQERVDAKAPFDLDDQGHVSKKEVFSPGFVYNQLNEGKDAGVEFPDALNLLSSQGVATWNEMPYNEKDFTTPPTDAIRAHAKINRIDTWRRVNVADTNEVKAHLAAGFPVMVGAQLDEGFLAAGPTFIWKEVKGKKKGGHAMLVVGYDDNKQAFKLLNSWGTEWGDHGYGWVDYEFFRKVVREGYVAKNAHKVRPAPQPAVDPVRPVNRVDPINPVNPVNPADLVNPLDPVVVRRVEPDPVQVDARPLLQQVSFQWGRMVHNVGMPGHPEAGACLGLEGQMSVPAGIGNTAQVVMFFYYDDGQGGAGKPIRSRIRKFATVQGMAADGTEVFPVGPDGVEMGLLSIVPYSALDLPHGGAMYGPDGEAFYRPRTTAVVAIPVLFIDGFGVKTGPTQHFTVTR